MKTVKISMIMDVDDDGVEEISKLTHHAEYLLDLENYPEIKNVYEVSVSVIDDKEGK